jgi:hypothetical protein
MLFYSINTGGASAFLNGSIKGEAKAFSTVGDTTK